MRQFLILIMGCLALVSWPQESLKASETPSVGLESSRKPPIDELIRKHANRLGVDPDLVHAVVRQESGFNPKAVSPKGAMGLMQLMPGTASLMGVNDPFDTEQNIEGGIKYLQHCLHRFDGDLTKALAAYNAGPQNVEKYDGCPPFAETRDYVTRVMQAYSGQTPLVAGGPGRIPYPPSRLSPAALAVLQELHPYRYARSRHIDAKHCEKPVPGKRPAMSPSAVAVLKELYPYRYHKPEGYLAQRPGKTK